jgi:hypothetical protein
LFVCLFVFLERGMISRNKNVVTAKVEKNNQG